MSVCADIKKIWVFLDWPYCRPRWNIWVSMNSIQMKIKKTSKASWFKVRNVCPQLKISEILGHRLAQLVERSSHVQRLCPRCRSLRLESRPGALRCVSLPVSLILFPVLSCFIYKRPKNVLKKKSIIHCWISKIGQKKVGQMEVWWWRSNC